MSDFPSPRSRAAGSPVPTTTPATRRGPRRLAELLGAGVIATGLLLSPAVAFADPAPTLVQTTDPAGDAHTALQRNVAAADILAAGVRVNPTTLAFFIRLTTAPTPQQLATGNYHYDITFAVNGIGGYSASLAGSSSGNGVTVSGGIDGNTVLGVQSVDPTANEVIVTVDRAAVESGIAPLPAGTRLQITGATATAPGPSPFLAGTGKDSAAAGPVVTLAG